jgi:hypothetical protein
MSRTTEATLETLRMKYQMAHEAYQGCVWAMMEADKEGRKPSPQMLASEAKAMQELTEARAALIAALGVGPV